MAWDCYTLHNLDYCSSYHYVLNQMASRKPNKGKEAILTSGDTGGVPLSQEKKPMAHWTSENKDQFIDLALEQIKIGNKPGKSCNAEGQKNIVDGFKEKTGLTQIRVNSRTYKTSYGDHGKYGEG